MDGQKRSTQVLSEFLGQQLPNHTSVVALVAHIYPSAERAIVVGILPIVSMSVTVVGRDV